MKRILKGIRFYLFLGKTKDETTCNRHVPSRSPNRSTWDIVADDPDRSGRGCYSAYPGAGDARSQEEAQTQCPVAA